MSNKNDYVEIIERIERRVNKVLRETNRNKVHWTIQKNLTALARELGYRGYAEKRADDGILDVIWADHQGKEVVAIEIDSSPRPRSVNKLNKRTAPVGVWIYYGVKPIPPELDTSTFVVVRPIASLRCTKPRFYRNKPKVNVVVTPYKYPTKGK